MRRSVVLSTAVILLASPAAARAATKTVDMGVPVNQQKAFQSHGTDVNDFFPHGVTVHAGDSVRFVPTGFHDVDIPARGKKPQPLLVTGSAPTGLAVARAKEAGLTLIALARRDSMLAMSDPWGRFGG